MGRLFFILFIWLPHFSVCQNERLIEVFGNSEISVTADNLIWTFNVLKEDNSIKIVKKEIDRATNELLDKLNSQGVLGIDIQTSGINFTKNYYTNEKISKFSGSNQITVKLKDTKLYSSIVDEIIQIENVFPLSPQLKYSKEIETRVNAREDALLAAKDKAYNMASVLGLKLGRIIKIDELPSNIVYPSPFNSSTSGVSPVIESDSFREGQIKIIATVKLVFELTD